MSLHSLLIEPYHPFCEAGVDKELLGGYLDLKGHCVIPYVDPCLAGAKTRNSSPEWARPLHLPESFMNYGIK